jgi:SAM-dependent methyltransferase
VKKSIFKFIYFSIKSDFVWKLLNKTLLPLSNIIRLKRQEYEFNKHIKSNPEIKNIFADKVVKNGPFKGLKYPSNESFGSSLYPKLLGSYEYEISQAIEEVCKNDYSDVLDIGCAEGYYAIGMALRMPNSVIHAYDVDPYAISLCTKMAAYNNLSDHLKTYSFCSEDTLKNFNFRGRGLIICDCEGYEKKLFTDESVKNLINCDIIIETHDIYDATISYHLEKTFSKSHSLTIIKSIDDLQKLKSYHFPEIAHLDIHSKILLIQEERGGIMEWHYYQALN